MLDVPEDVLAGLLNGELIRYGGVIRTTDGRLFTHLKEVDTAENAVEEAAKSATKALKNPWVASGVGVLVLAAVGGGIVLSLKRRRRDAKPEVPECVERYNDSLQVYLRAIRTGNLEIGIIDRLIADLDAVIAYSEESDTAVAFSVESIESLTSIVVEYTSKLIEANALELDKAESADNSEYDVVEDLCHHLKVQRRIFDEPAQSASRPNQDRQQRPADNGGLPHREDVRQAVGRDLPGRFTLGV